MENGSPIYIIVRHGCHAMLPSLLDQVPHRMSAFHSSKSTSHMKPASLSRDLHAGDVSPRLLHSLQENKSSVLSLAATDEYIFSGSQNRDILVRIIVISAFP